MSLERLGREKLSRIKQEHILSDWEGLSPLQREELLQEISSLGEELFHMQKEILALPRKREECSRKVFQAYSFAGNEENFKRGVKAIEEGRVACLIVAGGQGSRLRFDGPKGLYPISIGRKKSLFQIFAEKTLSASVRYKQELFLAIMTSPSNHEATVEFFEKNHYFGLPFYRISFFCQKEMPLLDEEGKLFLEAPSAMAKGPCGNGYALHDFYHSGVWSHWKEKGVEFLNFIMVDNPLADPFDAELIGFHLQKEHEVTIKCVYRKDIAEKVGVLFDCDGAVKVVEYTETLEEERKGLGPDGSLKHCCANIGLYAFSMDFIEKIAENDSLKMPLHLAKKSVRYLSEKGEVIFSDQPNAWKFEAFIFDVFSAAENIGALLYPRSSCFAPLKELKGPYGVEAVRKALLQKDLLAFSRISREKISANRFFELSQDFHYPTKELFLKWMNRPLPNKSYIES